MQEGLWALIFSHHLDFFDYSLVCKQWYRILRKYPEIVWRRKAQEVLKRHGCPKHLADQFFVPQKLVEVVQLKPLLSWIYEKDPNTYSNSYKNFRIGNMRLFGKNYLLIIIKTDEEREIDYCTQYEDIREYDITKKVVKVHDTKMFNGQYYWTGPVAGSDAYLCPHGFGTAVVQGQTYHNVYAFWGILMNQEDDEDYPDMTQNLKKRKI